MILKDYLCACFYSEMKNREQDMVMAGYAGIFVNVCLVLFKSVVGVISGSIAVMLDAVNNLTDVFYSLITVLGIKLAVKPADREHPYGHGRVEYMITLFISGVVFMAGLFSAYKSVMKIVSPSKAEYGFYSVLILFVAVLVKLFSWRYFVKIGRKTGSELILMMSKDSLFDAMITFSTLSAALANLYASEEFLPIDGILGLFISLVIIKTGFTMASKPVSELVGKRVSSEIALAVKREILGNAHVKGVYDIHLHNYGPGNITGSLNIAVDGRMRASDIHKISLQIQNKIYSDFGIPLHIGIHSVHDSSYDMGKMQNRIIETVSSVENINQVHGVFIDEDRKNIYLDIVMDYSVSNKSGIKEKVREKVKKEFPGYEIFVVLDLECSEITS